MHPVSVTMLGMLGAAPVWAQANPTPVEVVDLFHAAQASGDSVASLRFLAPDVVIFESGGVEASIDEYRQHHLPVDVAFAAATKREIVDRQSWVAGDVAWVLTQTRVTGRFRDREIDSRGVETMLLRREAGRWRIVHVHWSSRRAE